jgi:hypothetical protein
MPLNPIVPWSAEARHLVVALFWSVVAFIQGLWFAVSSPREFVKFMRVYKKHQESLNAATVIRDSGFTQLPRSERRKVSREVRKQLFRSHQHEGNA